ncbi:MAG: arsenic transporter, partial [archaeon GB-1867-005]|nr:arsenic transporter [Candidatus Culexmicrobium cathedralense]
TLPLALPIAVVKRFISMVQGFNIPTGGVIVNQVIPEELVKGKKVSEYMINKYKEQQAYLEIIRRDLWPMVRAIIPLYETEILGVDMVAKVAENLISWQP